MTISTRVRKWSDRTKHAIWALMFLVSYGVSMAAPFIPTKTVSALDTGWNTPTATHSPNDWDTNTVANIQTSNNQYVSESGGQEQGYSFNIPSIADTAVVSGVEISAEAKSTDNNGCRLGVALSWNGGSSYTSYQYANLGDSDITESFGSSSDTWGRTWSASELSPSNFVVKLLDYDPGNQCDNSATTSVDVLSVKIYYTVPVTPVANPALTQACGLDIALVIDNSTSIDSTEMGQMKTALTSFTNALAGTPTEFSVTKFATSAQVIQPFTSDVSAVNTAINGVPTGGGYTNWEDGFVKAASTLPNRSNPNLVIFATDGDPTTSNTVGGTDTNQPNAHLEPAITAANSVKNSGTRILALGIGLGGDSGSVSRLKQISGPLENTGSVLTSDVITTNFSTLAGDLATFAKQTCGGTITVKKLIDKDGNPDTTYDQTPAAGWTFDINGGSNPDATTTDANGLTPAVKVSAGTGYSVSEISKSGYSLIKASCTNATNNGSWSGGLTVNGVQVGANDIINCTFINKLDTGKVKLIKEVDNTYGGTLGVNDFRLSIGGTSVLSGQELTVSAGTPVAINEVGEAGYQFVSITGEGCPTVLGGTVTPVKDKTITCTIKNASKPATLIVKKIIHNENGGTKTFTDFSYSINGGSTIAFKADGSNSNTLAAGTYTVLETADNQYDASYDNCTNVVLTNGATATCTITNTAKSATLTLNKTVINQYGSNKSPSDFTPLLSGENVPSTIIWGQAITLKAGTYTASEVNLPGFEGSGWTGDCAVDGKITLKSGDNKSCSITNTALPTSISGKKIVSNADLSWVTAGTNPAAGWTIFLDQNQNGVLDNGEVSTVTDANGNYSFTGLSASMSYYVKEVIPTLSGWEQITGVKNPVVVSTVGGSSTGNNFTNMAYGTITVTKQIEPANDSGKFNLLVRGQVKAANVGDEGTTGKLKVEAGTYSVAEAAGTNTSLSDYGSKWTCDAQNRGGSGNGTSTSVTVKPGENWVCTFTNTRKTGTIKVVKMVVNDNGGKKTAVKDFSFRNNGGSEQRFSATYGDNGEKLLTLNIGTAFNIKEIQENKDGYSTTYSGCSGMVTAGTKTCTITNNDKPGTITVIKNVDDGFGHISKDVKYWTWSYDGKQQDKHHIATGSNNTQTVPSGTYKVSEDQKPGYHVVASSCKSSYNPYGHHDYSPYDNRHDWGGADEEQIVKVGVGQDVTCEFTNKRDTGTITVHKKIDNKWNPWGWTWWLEDNGRHNDMGDTVKVETGSYWFGENQKHGYSFESLKCKEGRSNIWVTQDIKAKIYVGKDDHIECVFTNSRDTGTVTVVKDAQPDSSQGFMFTIEPVAKTYQPDSDDESESEGEQIVQDAITRSSYEERFYSWHHDGDAYDEHNPTVNFTLVDSGDESEGNTRTTSLPTGKYRISETAVKGWDLSDVSCGESRVEVEDGVVYVYVTKGVNVVCTFTNTQRAQLTIVKDAQPNGSRVFNFTSTIPDSLGADTSFSLVDDGSGLTNSKKFENLKPGTYTVTETATSAWRLDNISCTGSGVTMTRNGYVLTVTLAAGAMASCTFVNAFVPQVLAETTLVNTGTETIIAATIAVLLSASAIVVATQRRKAYVTVRKD